MEWHEKSDYYKFIDQAIYGENVEDKPDNIDSNSKNCDGWTVAMICARLNKEIPQSWYHDKLLPNNNEQTVGILISEHGKIPDDCWMHDIDKKDKFGNSIRSNLLKYNLIYDDQNRIFEYNVRTTIMDEGQYCNECDDIKTEFIVKTCNCQQQICFDCYQDQIKRNRKYICSECNKENLIEPKNNEKYQEYLNSLNNN